MRRPLRLALLAALLGTLLLPGTAQACSCATPGTPTVALERSDAVFLGRVVAVMRPARPGGVQAVIEVSRVWKGEVGYRLHVFTGNSDADCGFRFLEGREYLIYAYAFTARQYGIDYGLATSLCSRTSESTAAAADLAELGTGQPPSPTPRPVLPPVLAYAPQCHPETGWYIPDDFFYYWKQAGGLARFGHPLTDASGEILEDGRVYLTQWFERGRIEYHRENRGPYLMLQGHLGRLLHPADPPVPPLPVATYFAETGHNVTRAEFADYWTANGGLAQFGYPLSEEFTERLGDGREYRVQYFERARFEWHPENPAQHQVQLGHLGREVLANYPPRRLLPGPPPATPHRTLLGFTDCAYQASISPDGRHIAAVGRDETLRLWDAATGTLLRTFKGHLGPVRTVGFSPDGKLIATAGGDETIRLWDVAAGRLVSTISGYAGEVMAIVFSPDGKRLASWVADYSFPIRLWDVATGTELSRITSQTLGFYAPPLLLFSADGRLLSVGISDREVVLWEVLTLKVLRAIPKAHFDLDSVALGPDGGKLLIGYTADDGPFVQAWDLHTGKHVGNLADGRCQFDRLVVSPDGRLLAGSGIDDLNKRICVWDMETGRLRHLLSGHQEQVTGMHFSPAGDALVSSGLDGAVRLWSIAGP